MRHVHGVAARAALCFCLCGGTARAIVQTIDARAESNVRQFVGDGVVNSDQAIESLNETTSNLPLIADARLSLVDSEATVFSSATTITTFSDPTLSDAPNPREFGLELVAYSFDPVTRYEATGAAVETREIVFTAEEIGVVDGAELEVTSHFFLDGFLIIWGDLVPAAVPTGAQLRVEVYQTRSGQERQAVMQASLRLSQNSDGSPLLVAEGDLGTDNVVLLDTLGSVSPLGDVYLVALPAMSIPYTYNAMVGETFTLEAEVECRVENQPFTGVGVVLGVPLDRFVNSIGDAVRSSITEDELLAKTAGVVPPPAKPLQAGEGTQVRVLSAPGLPVARVFPCGGLGIESLALTTGFAMLTMMVWFRRWSVR